MNLHLHRTSILTSALLFLLPCFVEAQQEAAALQPGHSAEAYSEFNTSSTIRDIMNSLVDPNADVIWNSVRFVANGDGATQYVPETEEDWETLKKSAVAIVEGANALMIPGRRVAPEGATTEFPKYEYQPEEVEQKLRDDRLSWIAFAQNLQNATLGVLQAIESKDAEQLMDRGGVIDAACEACHSQYWYRQN